MQTTQTKARLLPALLLGLAGLAVAPLASAQDALGGGDALGSGNALDANPLQGSGGSNPLTRDWNSEIAYRNAIVTGNVGGGREFRGNLGYSGISDFRGALGSDLVYNFQRETFYSGLAARRVRGIEATALQLQSPLSGQRGGAAGLTGGLIINRPGSGVISSQISQPGNTPQDQLSDLIAFDRVNNTLRSTSAYAIRDAARPQVLGQATDGTNNFLLTASPLGGVDALNPLDPALVSGRSFNSDQFDFDPRISIPGFRERAIRDRMLMDELEDAEDIARRMPSHNRILDDLRDQAVRRGLISEEDLTPSTAPDRQNQPQRPDSSGGSADTPGSTPGLSFPDLDDTIPGSAIDEGQLSGQGSGSVAAVDELDRLLRGFSRELMADATEALGPNASQPDQGDGAPQLGPTRLRRTEDPSRSDPQSVDDALNQQTMDRMIDLLRNQRTTIDRIAPTEENTLYAQHMRAGERLLAEGMWFIAEERFVAALSAKSGDAMAAIGRVHAQIGAGLYLSAATNLADLLRAYPELATVRYEDGLLPSADRLDRIRTQLRARSVDDNANARNAGFLLAYLGYQAGRESDVREGFAVVDRVNEALDAQTDSLMKVLAELWTENDQTAKRPDPGEHSPPSQIGSYNHGRRRYWRRPPRSRPGKPVASLTPVNPLSAGSPPIPELTIPAGEAIAIHDFLTDGSFPALCEKLTDLFSVEVTFRDRHGGKIESAPAQSPPWKIHEPSPADAPIAEAIETGASCIPVRLGETAALLPLRIAERPMGGLLIETPAGRPADPDLLERVTAAAALLALTVVELCNREVSLRRRNAELDVLFKLSSLFVGAGDIDELLSVALTTSRQILGVDAGTIHLLERDDREMAMHAATGLSEDFLDWFKALDAPRAADPQALGGGVVVVPDFAEYHDAPLREAMSVEGLRSMLSVGLVFKNKIYGVMRLFTHQPVSFRQSQQMLARSLGEQISAAVAAARLESQRRRDRQMRRHVRLAADVQQRMLASDAPSFDTLDVAARYESSLELGGDFYDLIDLDGWLGIVIGDVVGKGVPAALLMASVRSLFRAHATHAETVSEVARRVNHTLTRDTLPGEFATAFAAWIDPDSRELSYTNAGHDPPIVIRAADPTSPIKLEAGGPLLGVDAGFEYEHDSIILRTGDTLIAYTDGVTDAMDFDQRKFGRERLLRAVREQLADKPESTARDLCDRIIWDIRRFVGLNTERDDITLIVLRAR